MKLTPILKRGCSFALSLLSVFCIYAQEVQLVQESDNTVPPEDVSNEAIISEREEVELVEDSDVREAIARRPDLQFNNVTIDGERADVSLSEIPADAVSDLEVLRANTPDMDADARGGSLNLSSNPTFNLEKPVFKADAEFQYTPGEDTWEESYSVTYGQSFGKFGFRFTTSYENEHDLHESWRVDWIQSDEDDDVFFPKNRINRVFENWHFEHNYSSRVDYKFSESFYLYAQLNYEQDEQEGYYPRLIYRFNEPGNYTQLSDREGVSESARIERDFTGYESSFWNVNGQLGGVYEVENFKMDFQGYFMENSYIEPDWWVIQFTKDDVDLVYTLDEDYIPELNPDSIDGYDDPESYIFDELSFERWQVERSERRFRINTRRDFEIGEFDMFAKAGVKFRSRERTQSVDERIYTSFVDDQHTLADISEPYDVSLIDDDFEFGHFPVLESSREFVRENLDQFEYNNTRSRESSDPSNYWARENVTSAYMMLNFERRRLRGIVGARFEKTDLSYDANEVEIGEDGEYVRTIPRTDDNSYDNIFPSVHFRYFLGSKITVIAAWTGTIERPFYGNVIPYRNVNHDDQSVEEGNPELSPTLYNNIDFSIDYRLSDSSMFSIEFFNKEVEDIVYSEVSTISGGQYDGYELFRTENGPSASERGVKFIYQKNLEEFHSVLEGFSLNLKLTLQDSETEYPNRPGDKLPVTFRPDYIFDSTLTYQKDKIYMQFQYTHTDDRLENVDDNAWHDRYRSARTWTEFSGSYQLTKEFRLFLNLKNITRTASEYYYGVPERTRGKDWTATHLEFGFKWSL